MPTVTGTISRIRTYEEEGRTDWALVGSRILWTACCLLFPFALFRFLNDLFNPYLATLAVLLLLVVARLSVPLNLVALDELMVRIFPTLRSAVRLGRVRIHDFRVKEETGAEVSCLLRGDLRGGAPMVGDRVQVEGGYRWGTLHVRRGFNETTGAILAPRPLYSRRVFGLTTVLFAAIVLYLWGALDSWLYPGVATLLDALWPQL